MCDTIRMTFDPTDYKLTAMQNWDVVAPGYHASWASVGIGPFKSTPELVNVAEILPSDRVLDLACGTGAVSSAVLKKIDSSGTLVGIDISYGALSIAKSLPQGHFAQMDAENIGLHGRFNKILCQYALMFFPDAQKVLRSLRNHLLQGGRLAIAVHGTSKGVPYFSTIMEPVLKIIPDIRPPQAPSVHRFGELSELRSELHNAGYENISINRMQFEYNAGTFEQYWLDYLSTTANSIRKRLEEKESKLKEIKREATENASKFATNGKIVFPWEVLRNSVIGRSRSLYRFCNGVAGFSCNKVL